MKKELFHLLALLLVAASLSAQERPLSVSIQAGPSIATVKPAYSEAFDPQFRSGFFAGGTLRWAFAKHWSLPVDLSYAQRGFAYTTASTPLSVNGQWIAYRGKVDYRASYFDVTPQIEFNPIQPLGIALGFYVAWRLAEDIRYGDVVDWTDTKYIPLFKNNDMGLQLKVSGHFKGLLLFAACQFGLASSSDLPITDENGQSLGTMGLKNRSFTAGAGYRF